MLTLQNISYLLPNGHLLFNNLNFTQNKTEKIALVGHNGSGKSTLFRIIDRSIAPTHGEVMSDTLPYLVPQIFGQYNELTVAEALRVDKKMDALYHIIEGKASERHFETLNDDWTIETRIEEALEHWQLTDIRLTQRMGTLSGGQQARIFLSGIFIHQPELVLLDEPSNHLDGDARNLLYHFLSTSSKTILLVSHDRQLLNLVPKIGELSRNGIHVYPGGYDFYLTEKQKERDDLIADIHHKEKDVKKARHKERETLERQQKLDARGKRKQEKSGVARIMMNTLRNNAEKSTSKLRNVHGEKIGILSTELQGLRNEIPEIDQMKFGFDDAPLHVGKVLFDLTGVNFSYGDQLLWEENLDLQILSGERIAIKGRNGSGKTTLISLLMGELSAQKGIFFSANPKSIIVDQNYSLIDHSISVYEQAQQFNTAALQEYEVKTRLTQFLFDRNDWDKSCAVLSGGERMRLLLCCLNISAKAPDVIVLDEPTNNLDLQNIEILTKAINGYKGTLLIISHDEYFLSEARIERNIAL